MQLTRIDRDVHLIQPIPFLHAVEKEVPDAPWVTYLNKATQRWTLGVWANKMKGLVKEYFSFALGELTRQHLDRAKRLAWAAANNPLEAHHIAEAQRAAERDEVNELIDYQREYTAVKHFTRRNARGLGGEAPMLQG